MSTYTYSKNGKVNVPKLMYGIDAFRYKTMFMFQNAFLTLATMSSQTFAWYHTTIYAQIITFYESRIAYIIDMKVIEYENNSAYIQYNSKMYNKYLLQGLMPDGITELRLCDSLQLNFRNFDNKYNYEVFKIWYKSIKNIKKNIKISRVLSHTCFNQDIIEHICKIDLDKEYECLENAEKIVSKYKYPFKIQHLNIHGDLFRIVAQDYDRINIHLHIDYKDKITLFIWKDHDETPRYNNLFE
jgi:hypothetical protein